MKQKRTFVIGSPIKHSRSPLIHNHWLAVNDIRGEYKKREVKDRSLKRIIEEIRNGKWVGGNVTLPHKQKMFELVDQRDKNAKRIGAVNTLWKHGKKVVGGNTDAYGFAANLNEHAKGWDSNVRKKRTAVVLGAGGAARAVVDALAQKGFQRIIIANRTIERAINLAKDFGQKQCQGVTMEEAKEYVSKAGLVVNTIPPVSKGSPISIKDAPKDCIVTDIVYAPLVTPLLKQAKKFGLVAVDGLGMLIHQATPGFKKWFGVEPEVTEELRQILLRDLGEMPKPKKTMFVGITGSIGMGKSTVANMFRELGVPVCDSDKIVHKLYQSKAVPVIRKMFGNKVIKNGSVNRAELAKIVVGDEAKIKKLESVIHPLVAKEEQKFKRRVKNEKAPVAIFDSPLLLERKNQIKVDKIIVVTTSKKIQKKRVMKREGMTIKKFEALLSRQVSDKQKREKADIIIDTTKNKNKVREEVKKINKRFQGNA